MHTLAIDIETYSSVDISKSGLYKYVQSDDFEILLIAYAYDDEPVQMIDLTTIDNEEALTQLQWDLNNSSIQKTAYNAVFEWYCLSKFFDLDAALNLPQWQCTMAQGLYNGYPAGLAAAAEAIGLPQNKQKMTAGKALIKKFCSPCKPTKKGGGRTRNLPQHEPEQWELFKEYCKQDVVVERELRRRLKSELPPFEQLQWELDALINSTGVMIDRDLVAGALAVGDITAAQLTDRAKELTGLTNPNSVSQLKSWLSERLGRQVTSLTKDDFAEIAEDTEDAVVKEVLSLRARLGKSSLAKYNAMQAVVCADGRARGLLQYYGASRSGRWAGRLIQVQNLPRNYIDNLSIARKLVKERKVDELRLLYGNVPDTVSQLIRTAFVPAPGNVFVVADYSAIEARVIAWLAGEDWRLEVFRTHGKIYEASASQTVGVPLDKIVKGRPEYTLRQKGKVMELALGYQGGPGALIRMGALDAGLTEDELPGVVRRWRQANPAIKQFWTEVEDAALSVIETGVPRKCACGRITITRDDSRLIVTLPSGRQLYYNKPCLIDGDRGKILHFWGANQTTGKWELTQTYGGKLVENIVQATARDCLAEMINRMYYSLEVPPVIRFHVHDELIIEVPQAYGGKALDELIIRMRRPPDWALDLPLNADGFITDFYKKE